MKMYEVTGPTVQFPAGVILKLTKGQAADRAHCLEKIKAGVFEATAPVEFKQGECLGVVADSKSVKGAGLEPVGKAQKAEAQKAEVQKEVGNDGGDNDGNANAGDGTGD